MRLFDKSQPHVSHKFPILWNRESVVAQLFSICSISSTNEPRTRAQCERAHTRVCVYTRVHRSIFNMELMEHMEEGHSTSISTIHISATSSKLLEQSK